jgi:hypothetical protein
MHEYDIFKDYIDMTSGTEVPAIFRRWAIITGLGAWIGRDSYFKFSGMELYPNLYVMLLGASGAKKSSAIKRIKRVLSEAGYNSFAAEKTTKEKFLMDLAGMEETDFLDSPFDSANAESFITADEFNDFFGNNIFDFLSTLGVLWDFSGIYKNRIKNGAQVEIADPVISILAGNTQTTLATTFPPEALGQGFFSRIIAVFSEPSKKRIAFPPAPSQDRIDNLITRMREIKLNCCGALNISEESVALVTRIYETWIPVEDERFAHYSSRRLIHLLKLITIHATARNSNVIEPRDIIYANTILSYTEHFMPKAFGEFGRGKHAGVAHKVLEILEAAATPLSFADIWELVHHDLSNLDELGNVIKNLTTAGKIKMAAEGLSASRKKLNFRTDGTVDFNYLTKEELES